MNEELSELKDAWLKVAKRSLDLLIYENRIKLGNALLSEAETLKSVALLILGVACPYCRGFGKRTYSNTSAWRHGIGGQMMTVGICDLCWGTGRTDETGVNLKKLESVEKSSSRKESKK